MSDVFNEAVDWGVEAEVPAGTPIGVAQLSYVLRVYNAIMSGGLGFAIEAIKLDEFEPAVEGFRYLDLGEAAGRLAELVESHGNAGHDFEKQEILEHSLSVGSPVHEAFERKARQVPTDFGRESSHLLPSAASPVGDP